MKFLDVCAHAIRYFYLFLLWAGGLGLAGAILYRTAEGVLEAPRLAIAATVFTVIVSVIIGLPIWAFERVREIKERG